MAEGQAKRLRELRNDAPLQEEIKIIGLLHGETPYVTPSGNLGVTKDVTKLSCLCRVISVDEAIAILERRLAADGMAVRREAARRQCMVDFEVAVRAELEGRIRDMADAIYEMLGHVWAWGVPADDWLRGFRSQYFREEGGSLISWPTFLSDDD